MGLIVLRKTSRHIFNVIFSNCYQQTILAVAELNDDENIEPFIEVMPSRLRDDARLFDMMASTYRALVAQKRDKTFARHARSAHYLHLDLYPLFAVKSWFDLLPEDLIIYTARAPQVFAPAGMMALHDLQLTLMRFVMLQTIPCWLEVDQRDKNQCENQIRAFNTGFNNLMDEHLSIQGGRFFLTDVGERDLHDLIMRLCRDLKRVDSDRPITEF